MKHFNLLALALSLPLLQGFLFFSFHKRPFLRNWFRTIYFRHLILTLEPEPIVLRRFRFESPFFLSFCPPDSPVGRFLSIVPFFLVVFDSRNQSAFFPVRTHFPVATTRLSLILYLVHSRRVIPLCGSLSVRVPTPSDD